GNDGQAEPEIVLADRVGDAVARVVHRTRGDARSIDGLFDRVDPDVHGAEGACQLTSYRGLARPGQTAQDDQQDCRDRGRAVPCLRSPIAGRSQAAEAPLPSSAASYPGS